VRTLTDGEFVTVTVAANEPIQALAIPRAAVLQDQQGNYVYVVDKDNKAQQRRIILGQSTPELAIITSGLSEGETVVLDGETLGESINGAGAPANGAGTAGNGAAAPTNGADNGHAAPAEMDEAVSPVAGRRFSRT